MADDDAPPPWSWDHRNEDKRGAYADLLDAQRAILLTVPTEGVSPRVLALVEAAGDMEPMLRFILRVLKELAEAHEATDDLETNQALAQGWALIRAIDERSKKGP